MSENYYILTPEQAKTYEKEALKYRYSLFQLMSEICRDGGTGTDDDICGIVDRIMSDIARVVVHPRHSKEHFIPYIKEYPQMVCSELTKRVEGIKVALPSESL
jgi:hypothetical protein